MNSYGCRVLYRFHVKCRSICTLPSVLYQGEFHTVEIFKNCFHKGGQNLLLDFNKDKMWEGRNDFFNNWIFVIFSQVHFFDFFLQIFNLSEILKQYIGWFGTLQKKKVLNVFFSFKLGNEKGKVINMSQGAGDGEQCCGSGPKIGSLGIKS